MGYFSAIDRRRKTVFTQVGSDVDSCLARLVADDLALNKNIGPDTFIFCEN